MKNSNELHVSLYDLLLIFAFASIILSYFYSSSYEYLTIQRSLILSIGYIPSAALGLITSLKPQTANKALEYFRLSRKKNSLVKIKLLGVVLFLLSLVNIYNAWKWIF